MNAAAALQPLYVGPTTIRCPRRCMVTEGATVRAVEPARCALPDVYGCPNGCGRTFALSVDLDRYERGRSA